MKRAINEIFKRQKLIILVFVLLFGYGIYSYIVIPKQEMPEIDTPYMMLSITAPSVSASALENDVVDDVEKLLLTYEDVTEVRSTIYDQFAIIITVFSYSTENPNQLSKEMYEKVMDLSLSDAITDISYSSNFDDPHVIFALHSDTMSEVELLEESNDFRNELMLMDEIRSVTIDSVFHKEVVITLNQDLLTLYGVSITDIYTLLYANSLDIPLGGLEVEDSLVSITSTFHFDELSDIENLIVIPEVPTVMEEVLLRDIATVTFADTSQKIYEFDGEKTTFLSVYFKNDIDFTKMGDDILEVKSNFLAEEGVDASIDEMLFLPDYVNKQINNVFYSLIVAIVVVMIVVLIGIGFRNSLLIIATIPVIIFTTIATLYLFHYELHKLTIVGLIVAIGILVDNSIVITEGVKRNIDRGMKKLKAAKKAIYDNSGPVLSSTLTTLAAFVVLVMLPGFLGEIVSSMPLTVIIAISLSYIVSMVLSPVLAVLFLKRSKKIKPMVSVHEKNIKNMIGFTIRFPLFWVVASILFLVSSVYFAFELQPIDLYPNDERSVLYIDYEHENFGDLTKTIEYGEDIIAVLEENEHVLNISSSYGGDLPNFHFSSGFVNERTHVGRIYVNLDYEEKDLLDYKTSLEAELSTSSDYKVTVNVLELSPPIAPVRVEFSGSNVVSLDQKTSSIYEDIITLESIKSYQITSNVTSPKFEINYDLDAIQNSYVTKAQIDEVITRNINGYDIHMFKQNGDTLNVSLETSIDEITDILDLTVYSTVLDQDIALSNFISIDTITDYSVIYHKDNRNVSYIDIYVKDGYDVIDVEEGIKDVITEHDTSGLTIYYGGENELFDEIWGDLVRASIIAMILIYIIMFVQFNNFVKPLIVYLTIPLSFSGSFLFLMIFNSPITATSLVGMVSLIGVTVNTGILLVEYMSREMKKNVPVKEACVNAVYLRFRPIMLTSLTTILGLIPLLLTGGNFFQPMAITFMGGMVSSTIITIFLVPSVYSFIYRKNKQKTTSD